MTDTKPAVAHPSATVVLLRDGAGDVEVLLVRRSSKLSFHGGAWVFPGGRIDAEDYAAAGTHDEVMAGRIAAVREAREEAGLVLEREKLVLISRWVTPEILPKRFDTWFFVGPVQEDRVVIDGGEIQDHRWIRVADALQAHRGGEIDLPPPTFVTLLRLVVYHSTADALAALARGPVESFLPRIHTVDGVPCSVYPGDVAYDDGDLTKAGPHHRLWLRGTDWRYERD